MRAVKEAGAGAAPSAGFAERALESGQRADHRVTFDRERDADVAGHAEPGAGHREHALLGQEVDEGDVIVVVSALRRPCPIWGVRAAAGR